MLMRCPFCVNGKVLNSGYFACKIEKYNNSENEVVLPLYKKCIKDNKYKSIGGKK